MLYEGGSRIVNPRDLSFVNLGLLEGLMPLTDGGHSLVEAPSQIFELFVAETSSKTSRSFYSWWKFVKAAVMDGIVKVIWQQKDCDIEAGHKSRCNHNSQACEAAFADYDNLGSTCFTTEAGFGTSLFKLPQILVPTVLMLKTFPPYPHRDWMFDVVCPK